MIAWSLSMWGMNPINVFHSWAGRVIITARNDWILDSFGSFLAVNGYFVPWVDTISAIWGIVGNGWIWLICMNCRRGIHHTLSTCPDRPFQNENRLPANIVQGKCWCNFWRTSTFGTRGVVTRSYLIQSQIFTDLRAISNRLAGSCLLSISNISQKSILLTYW